jgi:transcriptional regulator with XRE-family HTH domain
MASATREAATQRHWTCGRRLRERRHALGLTQAELVNRLGGGPAITNRSISTWENGRGLDFGWLPELAVALDCSVTYLLGMTDDPRRWEPAADSPDDKTVAKPATPAPAVSALPAAMEPAPPTRGRPPIEPTSSASQCNWILGPGPMPMDDARPTPSRSPDSQ